MSNPMAWGQGRTKLGAVASQTLPMPLGESIEGYTMTGHESFPDFAKATSQNNAATSALTLLKRQEGRTRGCLKHVVHAFTTQARAFKIPLGTDLARGYLAVMARDESL